MTGPGADRRAAACAWTLCAACLALGLGGVLAHLLPGRVAAGDFGSWWATNAVIAVCVALPGGLIAARRPSNPIGWLLLTLAAAHGVTAAAREYSLHALQPGSALPAGRVALWVSTWTYADFPLLVPLAFLFPDGRLPSRRWRPAFVAALVPALIVPVWMATAPGPMLPSGAPLNPLGWPGLYRPIARLGDWTVIICAAGVAAGLLGLLTRVRAAGGPAGG